MLLVHPFWQATATLLALYTFWLGLNRARFNHLGQKAVFKWKSHVKAGLITLLGWLAGGLGGLVMVAVTWPVIGITGDHFRGAVVMAPLIGFGLVSGLYMNARKKKRSLLPLLHGFNNLVLVILALNQARTGWRVVSQFVLGY